MKKAFNFYKTIWFICLVLFNVITFVVQSESILTGKLSGAFWVGYIFITLSFAGQLTCAYIAFKAETLKKLFYKISLISISNIGLIVMLVVGTITMVISNFPKRIGIIACLSVLCFTAIAVIKTSLAANKVIDVDAQISDSTDFIKSLTVSVQNLINRAATPLIKEQCEKVYVALRYSDPVSDNSLNDTEQRIKEEFEILTNSVIADNSEAVKASAKEIINLIINRNNMCKILKSRR